jgi:hypothetical protein
MTGLNFGLYPAVNLTRPGNTAIRATDISIASSTQIACTFNINGASPGVWDVVFVNADYLYDKWGIDTLRGGFTILTPVPVLVSPANNSTNLGLTPTLTWNKASNDSVYTVQLSPTSNFSSLLVNNNLVPDTFFSIPINVLSHGTTYYWKVCITEKRGIVTGFSDPWAFTTIITVPFPVPLLTPLNGDTVKTDSVYLLWSTGTPQVDRYEVEYATNLYFVPATR